jgi:hypothetical protein
MDQVTYDAAYKASLPPAILALMQFPIDSQQRIDGFKNLVAQGYIIDYEIMVEGEDPFVVMGSRNLYGYTGYFSYLQQRPFPEVPPGILFDGITGNPNQGPIVVYWPNPPAPLVSTLPTPPTVTLTVAQPVGNDFPGFYEMNGDSPAIAVGFMVSLGDGFNYTKTIIGHSPFAPNGNITAWKQSTKS